MSGTDFPGRHAVAGEGKQCIRDRISLIPNPSPGGRREFFSRLPADEVKPLAFFEQMILYASCKLRAYLITSII